MSKKTKIKASVRKPASPYSRVTSVIDFIDSAWFKYWVKSVGFEETERIGKESTEFGKAVHSIVENYLIGTPLPEVVTERQQFCGNMLVDWCKQSAIQPVELGGKPGVEVALQSEKYMLTGHPDLVGRFGDQETIWLVDWKTSKACRKGYALQLAAYAYMLEEQFGMKVDDGVIVRVPSDPNSEPQFETHTFHSLRKQYWPVFLKGLEVYQYFNGKGKWKKERKAKAA